MCPARGTGAALVMPHADKPAMTLHLAEISQAVAPGAHAVVLMDGAGWHKPGGRLVLPGNVSTLTLPAYEPVETFAVVVEGGVIRVDVE